MCKCVFIYLNFVYTICLNSLGTHQTHEVTENVTKYIDLSLNSISITLSNLRLVLQRFHKIAPITMLLKVTHTQR